MLLSTITSLPPSMNETMYSLNNYMCYLENVPELLKESSFIEHQSFETNSLKRHIPRRLKNTITDMKDTIKLQPEC